MANRVLDYLGTNRLFIIKQLPWQADLLTVNNPTNKMVYIRFGGQDVPNANNYDAYVVPFSNLPIKCHSAFFALALEGPPSVLAINTPSTARVTVTFSIGEEATSGTAYPVLQLSLANPDPAITVTADNTILGPYDLSVWGGLLAWYSATAAQVADQWAVTYEHSGDLINWLMAGSWPIWLSSAFALQLPRFQRYARLRINRLNGVNAFSASFTVRPSLNEILAQTILQTATAGLIQRTVGASTALSIPIFIGSAAGLALSIYSPPPNGALWDMQVVGGDALAASIAVPLDYFNVPGAAAGNKADGSVLGSVAAYNGLFTNALPWITPTITNRDTVNQMLPIISWRIPSAGQGTKTFDFNSYVDLQALVANTTPHALNASAFGIAVPVAGAWAVGPTLTAGAKIRMIAVGSNAASAPLALGFGQAAVAPVASFIQYNTAAATGIPAVIPFPTNTWIQVPAAPNNWLWAFSSVIAQISGDIWSHQ